MSKRKHKYLKLAGALIELGMSQEDLANKMTKEGIKITRVTLNSKLNGHTRFYLDEVLLICEIINRKPSEIFFD